MWMQHFRLSFRTPRKNPGFAVVGILVFGFGTAPSSVVSRSSKVLSWDSCLSKPLLYCLLAKPVMSFRVSKFCQPCSIVITRLGDAGRPILSYWWVEREYLLAPARLAENKAVDHAWSVGDSSLNDLCEGLALEVAKELGGHHSKKNEWSVVP